MAGASQREILKQGAIQALEQSRASMGGELAVMREQWRPRELMRQSVAKHKVALIIAAAAAAGFVAVRIFSGGDDERPQRPRKHWLMGLLSTGLMTVARKPLTDFAKNYLMNYLSKFQTASQPEQPE